MKRRNVEMSFERKAIENMKKNFCLYITNEIKVKVRTESIVDEGERFYDDVEFLIRNFSLDVFTVHDILEYNTVFSSLDIHNESPIL